MRRPPTPASSRFVAKAEVKDLTLLYVDADGFLKRIQDSGLRFQVSLVSFAISGRCRVSIVCVCVCVCVCARRGGGGGWECR